MKRLILLSCLGLAACSAASDTIPNTAMESVVRTEAEIVPQPGPGGNWLPYFEDGSHALEPILVGVMKLDPGGEPHPPHRHAEAEYLMVTSGRGEWYLKGERFDANTGDILFARSWDYHGIQAAGDEPLEFVIFKYVAKGNGPTNPDPSLPAEIVATETQ